MHIPVCDVALNDGAGQAELDHVQCVDVEPFEIAFVCLEGRGDPICSKALFDLVVGIC